MCAGAGREPFRSSPVGSGNRRLRASGTVSAISSTFSLDPLDICRGHPLTRYAAILADSRRHRLLRGGILRTGFERFKLVSQHEPLVGADGLTARASPALQAGPEFGIEAVPHKQFTQCAGQDVV